MAAGKQHNHGMVLGHPPPPPPKKNIMDKSGPRIENTDVYDIMSNRNDLKQYGRRAMEHILLESSCCT
jgi:hypothetical protein